MKKKNDYINIDQNINLKSFFVLFLIILLIINSFLKCYVNKWVIKTFGAIFLKE